MGNAAAVTEEAVGRSSSDNPFTPGFGNLPRVFAGRRAEFADLDLMVRRLGEGIYEQARLVTGDRGVGKTTLLRELEEEQAEGGRWVVRATATPGDAVIARAAIKLADVLADRGVVEELAAPARQALERLSGAGGSSGSKGRAPAVDRASDLERLLAGAAELARAHATVLLLLVDEAQNVSRPAIGDLFYAIQEVQGRVVTVRDTPSGATRRDSLPLGVVVAGLPGLVGHLQAAGSTFGERSKPLQLAVFGDADMREALRAFAAEGGATFDADAADVVMEACGGYPYFLHLIGQQVWNAGTGRVITLDHARAGIAAARPLIESFYEERLRPLGKRQREYLDATATLSPPERTAGQIAASLGTTSRGLASTWQALVDRHGLLRPAGGEGRLEFALPGMDRYLRGRLA